MIASVYNSVITSKIKAATDLKINGSILLNRKKILDFTSKSLKRLYLLMILSKNLLRSVSYRVQIKCFHRSSLGPMEFQTNETAAMFLFQTVGAKLFFYANGLFTLY